MRLPLTPAFGLTCAAGVGAVLWVAFLHWLGVL